MFTTYGIEGKSWKIIQMEAHDSYRNQGYDSKKLGPQIFWTVKMSEFHLQLQ